MSKLEHALALAAMGFWIFRLKENAKTPAHIGWQAEATRDPKKIALLFGRGHGPDYNIGLFTSKFKDKAAVAIDEDNKGEKKGAETLFQLDFSGREIPLTCVQTTPTGGRHHIYFCDRPLKQGTNVLGDGLDIRSRGGYLVGAGSTIDGVAYTISDHLVIAAPGWLVQELSVAPVKERKEVDLSKVNPDRARERAELYLENAQVAEEGGRNALAFKVGAQLKDRGVTEDVCLELICEWNENNEPPLELEELETTINSLYKTGQNAPGIKAAEATFTPYVAPVEEKPKDWFSEHNDSFALVMAGGAHHILWETTDHEGKYKLEHLNEPSFHKMLAYKMIQAGKKVEAQTKIWINDKEARRYDGIVFAPEQKVAERFFNLWRGFTVEPYALSAASMSEMPQAIEAFQMYLDHALNNVCNGNQEHFHWLMCRFASIFQRPWEKKLTALVFKGSKGVGKNALVKYVGDLLGPHSLLASKKRFLTGQFNSHFENCLLFTLDEAVWGGDKETEGGVKDLITGEYHVIERKGMEPYTVKNLTNVIIMGNEDWLASATEDERRYAVFNVGEGRKQDVVFFETMRIGMEAGGLRLLLSYFLNYDMKGVNVNVAPQTTGLVDQKIATLPVLGQWWFDCLASGELLGAPMTDPDFKNIALNTFRSAFRENMSHRRISVRMPTDIALGREMKKYAPSMERYKVFGAGYEYRSPGLTALRKDFENYLKGEIKWPSTENLDPFE